MTTTTLIQCPDCSHNVSHNAKTCPQCGAKLKFLKDSDPRWIVRGGSLFFFALFGVAGVFAPLGVAGTAWTVALVFLLVFLIVHLKR